VDSLHTKYLTAMLSIRFLLQKERVKVMMQAQENRTLYANDIECFKLILLNEGWFGLLTRGFGPTLAREIPSNAIYFVVYGLLMQTVMKDALGVMASMVCGAISGMACWIPVYPIDVVKTRMQNTKGGTCVRATDVAIAIYTTEGIGAFFQGIGLLLLRAAVSNGVAFWVYELILSTLAYVKL
jgi:solute carrier family 25 carnitine/acylcarnitine transporter 20/29